MEADILKVDFFARSKLNFQILRKKKWKNITKNHLICVKNEEKTVKTRLKLKIFSLRMQISRFCAKSEIFCAVARPHDRTF